MAETVKFTIDGVAYEAIKGENLLQFCLDRGLLVPHFCYHEALGPVGACRLCAAQVAPAADKPARLEMTCMTRIADGMVVSINDDYARKFRKMVIEDLMLNHPHDCPVCDEGGECMLQDMTVLSEHVHRRNRFPKRTWENQYLGPFIYHEMNRCITCYRCVRFYREYALGEDLGVFGSRDRVYFGRVRDGVLESEFAGNLVDVCPTGVFTNKRHREIYSRPWDLSTAPAVCINCSVGCNVLPGFRHAEFRRIKPLQNKAVNAFFMCDRGRFGGEYSNLPTRITTARIAGRTMPINEAIQQLAEALRAIVSSSGGQSVAALGSSRSSIEANAALAILMQAVGGRAPAYFATSAERATIRRAAALTASRQLPTPSMPEIEKADFVLNVGGDLTGEAPMLDLSVRQSIRSHNGYFSISPRAGKLDQFARATHRASPGSEWKVLQDILARGSRAGQPGFASIVATALAGATRPVILCSACHGDEALVQAAYDFAKQISNEERTCALAYYYPGANSAGVALAANDTDPGKLWDDVRAGKIKALVAMERNAASEFPSTNDFASLEERCEIVIAIDSVENATTAMSDAVLPCLPHYQSFGTLVNYELRAQRSEGVHVINPVKLSASEILLCLVQELGASEHIASADYHHMFRISPEDSPRIDALRANSVGVLLQGLEQQMAPPPVTAPEKPNELRPWNVLFTFGSEELSALAPPIAELAPQPALELHPDEARARGYKEGAEIAVAGAEGTLVLNPGLAKGTLGCGRLLTQATPVSTEVPE